MGLLEKLISGIPAPKGCAPYCKSALSRGLFHVIHGCSKSVKRGMIPAEKMEDWKGSQALFF